MKIVKLITIIGFIFLIGLSANGQMRPDRNTNLNNRQDRELQEDKVVKEEIKPHVDVWLLNRKGAFIDSIMLDTLQTTHRLYNPAFMDRVSVAYLGNYALPFQNNNFFERKQNDGFFFLNTRLAYLLQPDSVKFYNTRTPYTQLDYSQSENKSRKNETRFNVLHTQNVNPYWNLTFLLNIGRSMGQYLNQNSKNNFVTVHTNYNRDKLSIYGGFITNSIENNENGGLVNIEDIESDYDSDVLNVNLTNTRSEFKSNYLFANAEYRLGTYKGTDDSTSFNPIVGLIYNFKFENNEKKFTEDESETEQPFFDTVYYHSGYLTDKVIFNKTNNVLQIKQYENKLRKYSFGKRAFLEQEYVNLFMPAADSGYARKNKSYSNIYLGGGIFKQTGKFWRWNVDGRVGVLGRNVGETVLEGIITKPLPFLGDSLSALKIEGKIENSVPDYFQENYLSQHIRWDKNLDMSQNITVKGSFIYPKRKLEVGLNYSILNNYIYNDTIGVPKQAGSEFSVISLYLNKDFNYRNFHFITRLLYQKPTNDKYLHLPEFSAFVSTYYKFIIFKVMHTQLGVDTRYNTNYYADAYHPATGMFYLQDEVKVGNYPYVDAYVSLRLKRARAFFKFMNIGSSFLEPRYVTVPGYPMNRMTFRLGISWLFYD